MIIDVADNQEELDSKELYWIEFYNTYGTGGYNMSVGGQHNKTTDSNADGLSLMNGGREFLVFDIDGNYIKSAFSQTAFAEEIGVHVSSVNDLLLGTKGKASVRRFILIFKNVFSEEKLQSMIQRTKYKEFSVFDLCGEFIGTWNNQVTCANDLKIQSSGVGKCLNKKSNRVSNYVFYYIKEIPDDLKRRMDLIVRKNNTIRTA